MPEFTSKYFEDKAWTETEDKILNKLSRDDYLQEFPKIPKLQEVDFLGVAEHFPRRVSVSIASAVEHIYKQFFPPTSWCESYHLSFPLLF